MVVYMVEIKIALQDLFFIPTTTDSELNLKIISVLAFKWNIGMIFEIKT